MPRQTPRSARKQSPAGPRRKAHKIALVLGGGGLKGFAHIGVFRALQEMGIEPAVVAGTSIGALIASAYARGMPVSEMEDRARALKRRDLFRLNQWVGSHFDGVREKRLAEQTTSILNNSQGIVWC